MVRVFDIRDGTLHERENGESSLADAAWLDLQEPTAEERRRVEDAIGAELPDLDEVDDLEASPRCYSDEAGIHIRSLFPHADQEATGVATVAMLLQPQRLLTLRPPGVRDFLLLRRRSENAQIETHSPQDLLLDLLEQKVDQFAGGLERIDRALEDLGRDVVEVSRRGHATVLARLAELESRNARLHLCLMDTRYSVIFLQRCFSGDADQELEEEGREIARDIDTLMQHANFSFERINFMMQTMHGLIEIEQNRIVKILSVAAVVFLPPTLIASAYGMNFEHMPELEWLFGYPLALAAMLVTALVPYWWFKRKGWL